MTVYHLFGGCTPVLFEVCTTTTGKAWSVPMVDVIWPNVDEADEEAPGALLCAHPDCDDTGVPHTLQPFTLRRFFWPPDNDALITLEIEGLGSLEGDLVRVWKNANRTDEVTAADLPMTWTASTFPASFTWYIEGCQPSAAPRDVAITLTYDGIGGPCEDTVNVTVLSVDLDVDSDNTNGLEGTDVEDREEMGCQDRPNEECTGKWTWINNDDSDANGTADNQGVDADIINGVTDAQEDIGEMLVRAMDPAILPPGAVLYMETSDPSIVRVFDGKFTFSTPILGPGLPTSTPIDMPIGQARALGFDGCSPGRNV